MTRYALALGSRSPGRGFQHNRLGLMYPWSFLFDRLKGPSQHGARTRLLFHWFGNSETRAVGPKRPAPMRAKAPVLILNILQFRSKPTLDLDAVYRKHAGMVARRVRQFVPVDDVEEVVHEVFLKAHEKRDSFRGDASPVTWLYHVATNHCLNRIRNQKRQRMSLHLNRDLPWLLPSDSANSEHLLLIRQLWAQLSDEQSTIAMYYFVDGLTHAEIARITNVSRRTIGNRIDEITTRLRSGVGGKQ
jgi:RNA polymerase sigma-70 factor (ECF subfamily)